MSPSCYQSMNTIPLHSNPYCSSPWQKNSHLLHLPPFSFADSESWGRSCLLAPLFLAFTSFVWDREGHFDMLILVWEFLKWLHLNVKSFWKLPGTVWNRLSHPLHVWCHCLSSYQSLDVPASTYYPTGTLVPPFSSPSWAPVPEEKMGWGGPARTRRAGFKCLLGILLGTDYFFWANSVMVCFLSCVRMSLYQNSCARAAASVWLKQKGPCQYDRTSAQETTWHGAGVNHISNAQQWGWINKQSTTLNANFPCGDDFGFQGRCFYCCKDLRC